MSLNAVNNNIVKRSDYSVDITVNNIFKIVKSKGMKVFGVIDHQNGAKKAGLQMNQAKIIIFGNPKIGTRLMQKDMRVAIELPIKVLVYEDINGQTQLEYLNPMVLGSRYNLKGSPLLEKMTIALDMITNKARN